LSATIGLWPIPQRDVSEADRVTRALNGRGIAEVNRLCVRRDLAPMLTRDACSALYAAAAKWAARAGFTRLVTYVRADEDGASLRASRWVAEATVRGRGWHSVRRARSNTNALVDKVRWGRALRPKPVSSGLRSVAPAAPVLPDGITGLGAPQVSALF
jgi:cytosine/adenosine deaminase-related metal-dependent hydrolase